MTGRFSASEEFPTRSRQRRTEMTAEEKRNYSSALRKLQRKVVETAVALGRSELEGMERGVSEIELTMVLEQMLAPAFTAPDCRFEALRWFNWGVELVNGVRRKVGVEILLIQSGFRAPLTEYGAWK